MSLAISSYPRPRLDFQIIFQLIRIPLVLLIIVRELQKSIQALDYCVSLSRSCGYLNHTWGVSVGVCNIFDGNSARTSATEPW